MSPPIYLIVHAPNIFPMYLPFIGRCTLSVKYTSLFHISTPIAAFEKKFKKYFSNYVSVSLYLLPSVSVSLRATNQISEKTELVDTTNTVRHPHPHHHHHYPTDSKVYVIKINLVIALYCHYCCPSTTIEENKNLIETF